MKPENTVFIPGLWLNPTGLLANQIKQHSSIIPVLGINTMASRVSVLVNHLSNNPSIANLVGHSAGCAVIAEALNLGQIPKTVKKIVFLNPAPMPGAMFTPFDKIYWVMPKYIIKLIKGDDIKLSRSDARKLMSLTDAEIENLSDSFLPDSGAFTRHMVLSQWRRPYEHNLDVSRFDFTIVAAKSDNMVGRKTAGKVAKALFFGKKKSIDIEEDISKPFLNSKLWLEKP